MTRSDPRLPREQAALELTRRQFLDACRVGLGGIALGGLLSRDLAAEGVARPLPHHRPRAKHVIFLYMAGGPSQFELFEPKPELRRLDGQPVPASYFEDKRFAFISDHARLMGTRRRFARYGQCGAPVSELLPHTASIVDQLCFLRGVQTDIINHGPANMFVNTGSPRFGRPSMGSWVLYALGSESEDLPGFVVLLSGLRSPNGGAPLWGSGFLPSRYQGVPFRIGKTPILHLDTPKGLGDDSQGRFFDAVRQLDEHHFQQVGDPEIRTRIQAYETASRMQLSAPELVDLSREPKHVLDAYGVEPGRPSFATNCLLARRMVERGVRFVQLYHPSWDHHGSPQLNLGRPLEEICRDVDRPAAALVMDLEQRGLLDDTLVVFGGEFGRTPMSEVRKSIGRDHHIDGYTMWLAGGGVKPGFSLGRTDDLGFQVVEDPVHVHDVQATILYLLGFDHERLTFRHEGRDFRLTDVSGRVVEKIIA